jgi:hypothetical protein
MNILDVITQILTAICKAFEWWIDTGLMEDTVVSLVNICKYSAAVLVPLFWEYYFALKGEG